MKIEETNHLRASSHDRAKMLSNWHQEPSCDLSMHRQVTPCAMLYLLACRASRLPGLRAPLSRRFYRRETRARMTPPGKMAIETAIKTLTVAISSNHSRLQATSNLTRINIGYVELGLSYRRTFGQQANHLWRMRPGLVLLQLATRAGLRC